MDLVGRHPFVTQILKPALLGHKEQIGHLIGQNAVDLLGHRPVEGAKPRFDVSDQRSGATGVQGDLGGHQGAGER